MQVHPILSLYNCKIIQLNSYPIASLSKKACNEYPQCDMFITIS